MEIQSKENYQEPNYNETNHTLFSASQEVGLNNIDLKITTKRPDFRFYISYLSIILLCLVGNVVVHLKKGNEVYELIIGLLMLVFSLGFTMICFVFEARSDTARLDASLIVV